MQKLILTPKKSPILAVLTPSVTVVNHSLLSLSAWIFPFHDEKRYIDLQKLILTADLGSAAP